jgi:hypothetical protein
MMIKGAILALLARSHTLQNSPKIDNKKEKKAVNFGSSSPVSSQFIMASSERLRLGG